MATIKVDAKILSKLKHDIERAERMNKLPRHVNKIFKYLKEELFEAVDKGDRNE